jgi:hypothetical protein
VLGSGQGQGTASFSLTASREEEEVVRSAARVMCHLLCCVLFVLCCVLCVGVVCCVLCVVCCFHSPHLYCALYIVLFPYCEHYFIITFSGLKSIPSLRVYLSNYSLSQSMNILPRSSYSLSYTLSFLTPSLQSLICVRSLPCPVRYGTQVLIILSNCVSAMIGAFENILPTHGGPCEVGTHRYTGI